MCGIIGIVGKENAATSILEGLKRLEYRGYDSAGIAVIGEGGISKIRSKGKLANLEKLLTKNPRPGHTGIGHTRWATHGAPNEQNAHPHSTDLVSVVHNGIIENFQELKNALIKKGHKFKSDTDTEVIAVQIHDFLINKKSPEQAVSSTLKLLEGAYAIAVIFKGQDTLLIGARKGSPLAVGYGSGEMYLGSDSIALAPFTSKISYLEEGDMVVLSSTSAKFMDSSTKIVERQIKISSITGASVGKDGYRHYMQKEIFEQPTAIGETLNYYMNPAEGKIILPESKIDFKNVPTITLVACGTSFYAAQVASYWLERIAGIQCNLHIASEFRYREPILPKNGIALFISQSGETADTLAALRLCKKLNQQIIALVNSPESSMAHECDLMLRTYAGPEIGVASTKAFTTQLIVLAALSIHIGLARKNIDEEKSRRLIHSLLESASGAAEILSNEGKIEEIADKISKAQDIIYIGRGACFPVALEGALKLKEISYIHAEGFAAGELKHGPIALIDENVPVIAIAPSDEVFEKTASNIQEVVARGAKVVLISDKKGIEKLGGIAAHIFEVPQGSLLSNPILYALPVQLLAYHVAVLKGTDVDQPRNLAKSVTVE